MYEILRTKLFFFFALAKQNSLFSRIQSRVVKALLASPNKDIAITGDSANVEGAKEAIN